MSRHLTLHCIKSLTIGLLLIGPSVVRAQNRSEPKSSAGLLFSSRFESGPLAESTAYTSGVEKGLPYQRELADEGTIDAYMKIPTRAFKWTVDTRSADANAGIARVSTPAVSVKTKQTDLALLTVGVDLWVSQLRPVRLLVSSLNADGSVGGTLSTTLTPPVAGSYYRFTPDLSAFKSVEGRFDPTAARVRFSFEVAAADWPFTSDTFVLKVDNLSYATPSYYVSSTGHDTADGRSPASAFATPQHAVDAAVPGDVILLLDGTYISKDRERLVTVDKAGEPDRWIVLRSAPGHTPVLRGTGWDVLAMANKTAYVEIRGLTFQGYARDIAMNDAQADGDLATKDGKRYAGDPRMNTNGIAIDCRTGNENGGRAHHVRIIGNTVRDQPGAGIALIAADHLTVEGNTSQDNCHTMRYASSGISILSAWNFDADPGHRLFIVRNRSFRNRCFVKWSEIKKISDGNGIILDQFIQFDYKTMKGGDHPYTGRTLVQSNLVYGNGGSGIHAFASNHVDMVNNTAFHNAQSPELNWRQIFASSKCRDIHIVNNILWAQKGKPIHTKAGDSKEVLYAHNLIFGDGDNDTAEGGGLGTAKGGGQARVVGAVSGRPDFALPSIDNPDADFHLTAGSPAIGAGTLTSVTPIVDLDGKLRTNPNVIDLGAFNTAPRPASLPRPFRR